jgi:hypothetical protein
MIARKRMSTLRFGCTIIGLAFVCGFLRGGLIRRSVPEDLEEKPGRVDQTKLRTYLVQPQENLGNKLSNDTMMVMMQEKKNHSKILAKLLPELEVGIDQILNEDRSQTMDVRMRPSPTGILEAVGTSKSGNKLSSDAMMVMKEEKKNHSKILAELLPELEVGIDQILDEDRRKYFEHLVSVHLSDYPTRTAGRWVEKPPSLAVRASPALRQCLARERQGNCYSDNGEIRISDNGSSKRIIYNSPGIMKGYDPYMWESDDEAYAALPLVNGTSELLRGLQGRKIFIIGDSLSRQWAKSLSCELKHVYGYKVDVPLCSNHFFPNDKELSDCLGSAKSSDYIVFNFGHHIDPGKPGMKDIWRKKYTAVMKRALRDLTTKYGHIPPDQIFFRTTSVRHFGAGMGDWNTNTSQRGALKAHMDAKWDDYGGNNRAQPIQNLLALSMVGTQSNFSVLDVSPITLGRADSTSDGSHFCQPGPMVEWTRMLLHQILSKPHK